MKFQGYITLLLLVSCLSSTVSYGQGKDSTKVSVDDLSLLGECCIRETGLEKDTTTMGKELRYAYMLTFNYERQILNLETQKENTEHINLRLEGGLKNCMKDLKRANRRAKGFKVGMFTLTPIALIGGIWLGNKLGN